MVSEMVAKMVTLMILIEIMLLPLYGGSCFILLLLLRFYSFASHFLPHLLQGLVVARSMVGEGGVKLM